MRVPHCIGDPAMIAVCLCMAGCGLVLALATVSCLLYLIGAR